MQDLINFLVEASSTWGNGDDKLDVSRLRASVREKLLEGWAALRTDEWEEVMCYCHPLQMAQAEIQATFKDNPVEHQQLVKFALQADMQQWIDENDEDITERVQRISEINAEDRETDYAIDEMRARA